VSSAIYLTLAGCFVAAFCDLRGRRIPNWLTGSLVAAAVVLNSLEGLHALGISLAVMALLTAAGTLVYARGGIGGGDVKLAIAASGVLSYPLCVPFLLYTAIGGGLLALLFLAFRGNAKASVSHAVFMTLTGAQGIAPEKRESLPYAVAFAIGAIAVALSQSVAPFLRLHL